MTRPEMVTLINLIEKEIERRKPNDPSNSFLSKIKAKLWQWSMGTEMPEGVKLKFELK